LQPCRGWQVERACESADDRPLLHRMRLKSRRLHAAAMSRRHHVESELIVHCNAETSFFY
jgi:hypothetical protein